MGVTEVNCAFPYAVSWSSLRGESGEFYVFDRRPDDAAGRERMCPEQDRFYATPAEAWAGWRAEMLRQAKMHDVLAADRRAIAKKWGPA